MQMDRLADLYRADNSDTFACELHRDGKWIPCEIRRKTESICSAVLCETWTLGEMKNFDDWRLPAMPKGNLESLKQWMRTHERVILRSRKGDWVPADIINHSWLQTGDDLYFLSAIREQFAEWKEGDPEVKEDDSEVVVLGLVASNFGSHCAGEFGDDTGADFGDDCGDDVGYKEEHPITGMPRPRVVTFVKHCHESKRVELQNKEGIWHEFECNSSAVRKVGTEIGILLGEAVERYQDWRPRISAGKFTAIHGTSDKTTAEQWGKIPVGAAYTVEWKL